MIEFKVRIVISFENKLLSIYLYIYISIYLSIYLYICVPESIPLYGGPVQLPEDLSIYLSSYLSVYLSLSLSMVVLSSSLRMLLFSSTTRFFSPRTQTTRLIIFLFVLKPVFLGYASFLFMNQGHSFSNSNMFSMIFFK